MSKAKRGPDLSVAIVGAGRLGTALGLALAESGVNVVAVVCRRKSSARAAARLIGPEVVALGSSQLQALPAAEVVIIATPDDTIQATAKSLAAAISAKRSINLFHASGSLPSTVLRAEAPAAWSIGSIHPLLAVSDPRTGAAGLHSAYFCLEGEAKALRIARRLVQVLGGTDISVKTKQKALYHAAAVMAAGHVVALFDLAAIMLGSSGPQPEIAARMLHQLMQSAIRDLDHLPADEVMTGPFARGDVSTIERHLTALTGPGLADARAVYVTVGRHAIGLAEAKGIEPEAVRKIRALLDGE